MSKRRSTSDSEDSQERRRAPLGSRPLRGHAVDGKRVVVEYEPDGDLRDTEQVPLKPGWRRGLPAARVLPHAAVRPGQRSDWLRGELRAVLLQTPAAPFAGRDSSRHPGVGKGNGGAAG